MMKTTRARYTLEFKQEAVRLVVSVRRGHIEWFSRPVSHDEARCSRHAIASSPIAA